MIAPETFARHAARRVPRYTSYPTAPHFSAAVGPADYGRWLGQVGPEARVSIYLHIPFCKAMCWYCGCHTTVASRAEPVRRYVAALTREIRLVAKSLSHRPAVGHLHWGGGSPTLLAPHSIARITRALGRHFELGDAEEVAVEVDPRTLSDPVARAFAAAGVNRASLGVQSFDPQVQAAINRIQSFEVTAQAANLLRFHGIKAINLDLVYGLPLQTAGSCAETVEQALRLRPSRLAIFGYAHVPSFKPHQRRIREADLPGVEQRQDQFAAMAGILRGEGYVQIGLDHFALPDDALARAAAAGTLHRNFQGYTTDASAALLGFGASAIGRLPQGYVQNAVRIPDYQRQIATGTPAVIRGYRLSDEDRRRAAVIERLMCDYEADVGAVGEAPLAGLEAEGLIRRAGDRIRIADDARPLVRIVAAAFDQYLDAQTPHTVAV